MKIVRFTAAAAAENEPCKVCPLSAYRSPRWSNTAFFDRCLGWEGICVEPNPFLAQYLQAYRSCSLYEKCVHPDESYRPFAFARSADEAFMAHCLPLDAILDHAGLVGKTIDFLSVDIEKGEAAVFKNFPFSKYNIRYVVTEVGRWAAWLETDTYILANGYAKVAILGRDVV